LEPLNGAGGFFLQLSPFWYKSDGTDRKIILVLFLTLEKIQVKSRGRRVKNDRKFETFHPDRPE
jgi:hypothetical protein